MIRVALLFVLVQQMSLVDAWNADGKPDPKHLVTIYTFMEKGVQRPEFSTVGQVKLGIVRMESVFLPKHKNIRQWVHQELDWFDSMDYHTPLTKEFRDKLSGSLHKIIQSMKELK